MTLVALGVFLVFLDIRGEAERLAHTLDAGEPLVFIVRKREFAEVFLDYRRGVGAADILGQGEVGLVKLGEEVGDIVPDLAPLGYILAGLGILAVDVDYRR